MSKPPRPTVALPHSAAPGSTPVFAPPVANQANNFNLTRFLLATLVILSHSPELIDGDRRRELLTRACGTISFGELAVDGFFLLSGFLIVQSWERTPRLGHYLAKRALRIYPGFLVAALVGAFVVGPLGSPDPGRFLAGIRPVKFLATLVELQVPGLPPAFPGWPYPIVNGALWTIVYEARCYLLVAVLGLFALADQRRAWLVIALAGFALTNFPEAVGRLTFRGAFWLYGDPNYLARLAAFFAAGACFYLYRDRIRYTAGRAAVAALLLVPCMFRPDTAQAGLATLGAYVLFWFVFAPIPLVWRFRTLPDVSYGIYLYGWPIQKLVIYYIPGISPWLVFALAFALACGAGWLSWTFVEAPCLRWKRRVAHDPGIPAANPALGPATGPA